MIKEKITFSQLNNYDDSEALKTFFLEVLNEEITLFEARKVILENIEEEKKWDMFPNYETSEERKERIKETRASIQRVDNQITK